MLTSDGFDDCITIVAKSQRLDIIPITENNIYEFMKHVSERMRSDVMMYW
jgi:hypothetical protein